jgi:hypothetical protein
MLIDEIRRKISNGKIKEAINLLQNGSEGHEDELALHLMKLSLLEKNNRIGIIGYDTYNTQLMKTSVSILELTKVIDEEGKLIQEIDVSFVPEKEVKLYESKLEQKWASFFNYVGWDYLVGVRKKKGWIADFIIKGINQIDIEVEVKFITKINELKDKSRFIKPEIPNTSLSNCIILGIQPFISKEGFYQDDEVIQLGWIYNYDGNQWDNVVLKSNYDISNTKQTVYDLIKLDTNYKDFMDSNNLDEILQIWKKN